MKYYAVFTTDYELGCDTHEFENEDDLMSYVNSQLKFNGRNVVLIVSGKEIEIVSKEIITEWQIKS